MKLTRKDADIVNLALYMAAKCGECLSDNLLSNRERSALALLASLCREQAIDLIDEVQNSVPQSMAREYRKQDAFRQRTAFASYLSQEQH